MVRCFLAIDLSIETERFIADSIQRLRPVYGKRVRWVRPENCHITLKFLGQIEEGMVDSVKETVTRVSSECQAFEIELSGAGAFPSPRFPKVLWYGVTGQTARLGSLQAGIEEALASLGFETERRPFSPHVTVGRVKARSLTPPGIDEFLSTRPQRLKTAVEEIRLYQSILHRNGPEYRALASFRLGTEV